MAKDRYLEAIERKRDEVSRKLYAIAIKEPDDFYRVERLKGEIDAYVQCIKIYKQETEYAKDRD